MASILSFTGTRASWSTEAALQLVARVCRAATDPAVPIKALLDLYTQIVYEGDALTLAAHGVDFACFAYVPEADPATGTRVTYAFEDVAHKLKLFINRVRHQSLEEVRGKPGYLLNKADLLSCAEGVHDLEWVRATLAPSTDDQNVPAAVRFVTDAAWLAAVEARLPEQGSLLRLLGEAYEAFDMRGLNKAVRLGRAAALSQRLMAALQPRLSQAAVSASLAEVQGFPYGLVAAMAGNMDGLVHLYNDRPALMQVANERALSTDDLEGSFSALATTTEYRGHSDTVLSQLINAMLLFVLRRDPTPGVFVSMTTKGCYVYHQASTLKTAAWDDGSALADVSVQQRRQRTIALKAVRAMKTKQMMVRDIRKNRK